MKLIHVIPIARGISKETLSYFTKEAVVAGSLVQVPIRNGSALALVVKSEDVEEAKIDIKKAPFTIRKIDKIKGRAFLSEAFIEAANDTARYFVGTTGGVLNTLLPKTILEHLDELELDSPEGTRNKLFEHTVLQSDDEERFANYKSLIREEFARKSSLFFCLPTIEDIKKVLLSLPKGIEEYTFVLHGSLTKKQLIETWNKILKEAHPVLIISTGSFLCIPRKDISTIILEKESSKAWKTIGRPFVDLRKFAEIYARKTKSKLIFGDDLLRTETIWRYKAGELPEFAPLKFRSLTTSEQHIIDMNETKEAEGFRVLSKDLESFIKYAREQNENLFIFTARRGLSPGTVCGDCGSPIFCKKCSSPVVLHRPKTKDAQNIFMCHKCGEKRGSEERCKTCNSWNLQALGIGIELVEQEIRKSFPDIKIYRVDKDATPTDKKAHEQVSQFYANPGSVLLGTEMSLLHIDRKIDNSAIVSIDSLFSLPDFRINEKIIHLLIRMRSITIKHLIIQTRKARERILEHGLRGNLMDFYREEIEVRETYKYPPFTTLIKISVAGEKGAATKAIEDVSSYLAPYEARPFPAFTESVKGKFVMHTLVRVNKWLDEALLEKLYSLPPQYAVNVDPDSLL